MERREASTRTAANRAMGVQIRERPSKRQRRSFETGDQDESQDNSSSSMLIIFGAENTETTCGSLESVCYSPLLYGNLLALLLCVFWESTLAVQIQLHM
uniref:Uncharacterized protein n=2 Tax=Physcomitrium patens TaxID=3218 RepID=A0A7I3ZE90_PHYPA